MEILSKSQIERERERVCESEEGVKGPRKRG